MRAPSVYLYAVIPRTYDGLYSPRGLLDMPVALCSEGDLSAAISLIPADAALDEDKGHERVMRQLLAHGAVLPAPVPTTLPAEEGVHELLSRQQQPMLAELRRFQGLIEVRLRVRRAAAGDRRVYPAGKDTARAAPATAAGPQLLPAERERDYLLARLSTALRSGGFAVQALPAAGRRDDLCLACLLPSDFLALFKLTCESLQRHLSPTYELLLSPPMAAADFIRAGLFSPAAASPVATAAGPLAGACHP